MTAKISPTISIGSRMPVDGLAPKTKTSMATMMMLMPLIPDLDKPRMNAAPNSMIAWIRDNCDSTREGMD